MTKRADHGMPYDDDDDCEDVAQATPQPPIAQELQQGINILRYGIAGVSQFQSMADSSLNTISAASHIRAFEQIRKDAGIAGDPMAQLLVDGAVLAHIQATQLIAQAKGQPPQVAEIYHNASAKYLGETRKQVLALREYRSPVVSKQVTVVQQQNVAHGDQQVACLTANVIPVSLPVALSDEFATVVTDAYSPVAAITHEPSKTIDEMIVESFIATPEVQEQLAMMDASPGWQFGTQPIGCLQMTEALKENVVAI